MRRILELEEIGVNLASLESNANSRAIQGNEDKKLSEHDIGPIVCMTCYFLIIILATPFTELLSIPQIVGADCVLWGLPVYWVLSSEDITNFAKLKYNQKKIQLGYY